MKFEYLIIIGLVASLSCCYFYILRRNRKIEELEFRIDIKNNAAKIDDKITDVVFLINGDIEIKVNGETIVIPGCYSAEQFTHSEQLPLVSIVSTIYSLAENIKGVDKRLSETWLKSEEKSAEFDERLKALETK